MTRALILSNWEWPLLRQTPGGSGRWGAVQFLTEPMALADYVILLNWGPRRPVHVTCLPSRIWQILGEPPDEAHRYMHRGVACAQRVYMQDPSLKGQRYILHQPALPWFVDQSYDQLLEAPVPEKPKRLSCVTSNKALTAGHRARLRFLDRVRGAVPLDLYGRGFRQIKDKWDGLAPYRYSLAIENFQSPYYWSEKLADCFLAWTMPIYFGCTKIAGYFPPESMICIDIDDPAAVEKVGEVASSELWRQRLDAIAEARRLVLQKHQLFPFLAGEIEADQRMPAKGEEPEPVLISGRMRLGDTVAALPARLRHVWCPALRRRMSRMGARSLVLGAAL
jgi:hypothetical protein